MRSGKKFFEWLGKIDFFYGNVYPLAWAHWPEWAQDAYGLGRHHGFLERQELLKTKRAFKITRI